MKNDYSTILITGGAGFIGQHVNKLLHKQGYNTVVLDDLSHGNKHGIGHGIFYQGSIGNSKDLENIFSRHRIQAVMHFAALTDVGESVQDPEKYYIHNVNYTLILLEAMHRYRIKNFIFSSSAAIFGIPQTSLIEENHSFLPINPYGKSKLMIETVLKDYDVAYGLKSCCLRYFNAAGGDPEGELKNYKLKDNNLIPLILRGLLNSENPSITIFGTDYPTHDGTCIRDYIHVNDLASAHILALEQLIKEKKSSQYNLGNGKGFSVREVIDSVERVTGKKINVKLGERREGDPAILVACSDKAKKELGWTPRYHSLDVMIEHAWRALSER